LVVDAAKKQSERERERKTLLSEKRKCAQKDFDKADIVRDVRLARFSGVTLKRAVLT
jgi:hypothetical protein